MRVVSPEYFRAMRSPDSPGRPLTPQDVTTSAQAIVVNRTFATQYLGARPLGQRLNLGLANVGEAEVVGVVEDMRQGGTGGGPSSTFGGVLDPPEPEIFPLVSQWPFPIEDLIVRRANDVGSGSACLGCTGTRRCRGPHAPRGFGDDDGRSGRGQSGGAPKLCRVLTGFSLCALVIAGVGLFGVLSYATSQRTREIGLRTALGARRGDVLALVGQQALTITCAGLAVGLLAAFFLSQSLSTLLYGISTRDALSFVVVPFMLIVVSIAACAAPAWRATRIDPLVALRTE
jgi:hypothetical protein